MSSGKGWCDWGRVGVEQAKERYDLSMLFYIQNYQRIFFKKKKKAGNEQLFPGDFLTSQNRLCSDKKGAMYPAARLATLLCLAFNYKLSDMQRSMEIQAMIRQSTK